MASVSSARKSTSQRTLMNRSIYYSSPHRCNYKTILLFQPPLTKEERPFVGTWALSIVTPPFLTPLDVFLDTLRFKSCLMHDPSIRARSTVVCILRFFLKFFFCPFENNQTKRRDKSKWIFYKFYSYSIYIKLSVRKEKLNESVFYSFRIVSYAETETDRTITSLREKFIHFFTCFPYL